MRKMRFFSIPFPFILLTVTIYNNYYNPYNQLPGYNQNYYDRSATPIYPNRTEAEKKLTEQIELAFQDDPLISKYASSIEVYTMGQEVTLAGLIDSDRVKLRAETRAKNIIGVKKVINLINVEKTK
jgi:osmotically-inducible protein OsmY